ncbi:hypothetical protein HYU19_00200 [Candidatus Woesearchaeota archaeon]|nr:hypothetical protein [Candidatus Woesearchaeota archaeon]
MVKDKIANKKKAGTITCPLCGHQERMDLPSHSCQAFYRCKGCNKVISAEKSCCVFCDYSDRRCPVAVSHKKAAKDNI